MLVIEFGSTTVKGRGAVPKDSKPKHSKPAAKHRDVPSCGDTWWDDDTDEP